MKGAPAKGAREIQLTRSSLRLALTLSALDFIDDRAGNKPHLRRDSSRLMALDGHVAAYPSGRVRRAVPSIPRRATANRPAVDSRNQARRLSNDGPPRRRRRAAAHAQRA